MGLLDKLRNKKVLDKGKELLDKNGDKIAGGVDKVTNKIDEKTKGKYRDKLEKVDQLAQKLDKGKASGSGEAGGAAEGTTPDTGDAGTTDPGRDVPPPPV